MFPRRWCGFDVNDLVVAFSVDVSNFRNFPLAHRWTSEDGDGDCRGCVVNVWFSVVALAVVAPRN